ncbi:lysyl oxidase homolog 2-like isoform X2 [Daphnia pulicaria]|uniref:lysyl oxidase homolog 2-like isoform X1 n=1 Tax=Daphnia pulicaria TaxID=35523 RepID=UPI001EEA0158|nr:lysyl oxidase homolog 2-like isoform X1 [Daphnia pulicaria]XP_046635917.1 lysyl oxidase homolog 2-like isoform X1 [Daphnia pulicaria]XP_046635919.1 lysyl oxidase homolog 2-like isoform X2 [Daphnia pulicaria]
MMKTMAGQWSSSSSSSQRCWWKWLMYLSILLAILAECEGQQQQEQLQRRQQRQPQQQQRQRPTREGTRRQRRHRTDKAKLIQHYLKKNGRLEGMVRIVDGLRENEGNVEIYHSGKWGSICDDEWDIRDATVVCRELGYSDVVQETHNSMYGPARYPFWMDNLYCVGGENNLTDCRFDGWGISDCEESEAAGVICKPGPLSRLTAQTTTTTTTTTTSTTMSPLTTTTTRAIRTTLSVGQTAKPENSSAIPADASSAATKRVQQDMAPAMRIKDIIGSKGKIRLRGGRSKEEGRVEVKIGNNANDWGLICGDGWSLFEAGVVCRELKLGYAQNALQTDFFGGNRSSLALSGVKCHGSEKSLMDCLHDRFGAVSCPGNANNIATVVCASEMADLVPDHQEMMRTAHLEDRQLFFLQCAMEENCLAASAYQVQKDDPYGWHLETRRLLRFTARIANMGTADFKPFIPKHMWEWHACHMHYHSMEVFAHFDIINSLGVKVAEGHKASFCLEDNQCTHNTEPVYKCANYGDQGISVNCTDTYHHNIDCQWIDITDIDPGIYTFKVVINPDFKVAEMSFDNNAVVCTLYYGQQYATLFNCSLQRP